SREGRCRDCRPGSIAPAPDCKADDQTEPDARHHHVDAAVRGVAITETKKGRSKHAGDGAQRRKDEGGRKMRCHMRRSLMNWQPQLLLLLNHGGSRSKARRPPANSELR